MLLKNGQYSRSIILFWGVIDVGNISLAYGITNLIYLRTGSFPLIYNKSLFAIIILCWLSSFLLTKTYSLSYFKRFQYIIFGLGKCFLLHVLFLFFSVLIIAQLNTGDLKFIIAVHLVFLSLSILLRILQLLLYRRIISLKKFQTRYIIIGNTVGGQRLLRYLKNAKHPGFVFFGFFDDNLNTPLTAGKIKDIPAYCKEHKVNQIFYALSPGSSLYHQLIKFADDHYIYFGLIKINKLLIKPQLNIDAYDEHITVFPFQNAKFS